MPSRVPTAVRTIRRVLRRIRQEPVALGGIATVLVYFGLDDVVAEFGHNLDQAWVAGAVGVILWIIRLFTNSREHVREIKAGSR